MPIRALFKVRSRLEKGFMFDSQGRLAGSDAALSAQPIDESPVGDRHQPRPERPSRIVDMPDGMNGQQNVLDRVLYVVRVAMPPRGKRTQIRRYLLQKSTISRSVTLLGTRHQDGPIDVTDDRFRRIIAVGAVAPGSV